MVIDSDAEWSWYTGEDAGGIATGQIDFWSCVHTRGSAIGSVLGHTDTTDLCLDQTMYPSISSDDPSKRALGVGDIAGVSSLY